MGVTGSGSGGGAAEDYCGLLQLPEAILNRVLDCLTDVVDRSALSLVSKRLHAMEGESRQTVTISSCYVVPATAVASRFPNAKCISIKGGRPIPLVQLTWEARAGPWVEVVAKCYPSITHLKMKRMFISDADIERLVSGACGKSLHKLELVACFGFSPSGLEMVARECRNLVVLNLLETEMKYNETIEYKRVPNSWLPTLAETAKSLQVLDLTRMIQRPESVHHNVVAELASRCHTLRLCKLIEVDQALPVLEAAKETVRHMGIGILHSQNAENLDRIAKALRRCKGLEGLSALWFNPNDGSLLKVMRVTGAARLKSLDLTVTILGRSELADLLGTCVNLEDLQCTDLVQDEGLRKVGACCSKLRRLVVFPHADGFVTHDGLTAVAEGCFFLEKIIFYTADMTSTALETVANNCSNPSDIRICLEKKPQYQVNDMELERSSRTLDLGVKALLMKCPRARRLVLMVEKEIDVILTDKGLSYIGQHGSNLQKMKLARCGTSDTGFACIAGGCVKLQVLELYNCPFGYKSMEGLAMECPSLKQLWVQTCLVELQGLRMLSQQPGLVLKLALRL